MKIQRASINNFNGKELKTRERTREERGERKKMSKENESESEKRREVVKCFRVFH